MRSCSTILLVVAFTMSACTPYTFAGTARTVPKGETQRSRIIYVVPGGLEGGGIEGDSASIAMPGVDAEWRYGIDARSDYGVRVTSMSGVVMSYKRQVGAPQGAAGRATAFSVGGGITNFAQNALGEFTLVTSGREDRSATGYGGARLIVTAPLSKAAPWDRPTVGAFGGVRLGGNDVRLSFEIGAFYDRSALGLRRGDFIVVPAVNVHGMRMPRWLGPW